MLGEEEEDLLQEIGIDMDTEDDRLTVLGPVKRRQRPSRTTASIISLNSSRSSKPIPICSGAIRHVSDIEAVLTGC
jgi:hypothetical protein